MIKGIHLDNKKDISISNEVVDICNPKVVYIPLINNGIECKCIVKIGKKVRKDTIVGVREDINFPVLSSVSGKVIDIKKCLYLNNTAVDCVVIENDMQEKGIRKTSVDDITDYSKDGFIEILKECAVVGMGGSDFPTYLKYTNKLNTLIVNAVECEPYITSDLMLIKLKCAEIIEAINAIMIINKISNCYIAVKKDNKIAIKIFEKYLNNYPNIKLVGLKNMYPMGWERYIIKDILNINYIKYPSEKGIVVSNISTVFAIYKALKFQRSISKRIVTISGEMFNEPINVLVRIGTTFKDVLKKLGVKISKDVKIVAGGPMMGFALVSDDVVITKNLNCILVIEDIDDYEDTPCIRCGKCDLICPVNLSPVLIKDNVNNPDISKSLNCTRCVECGLCSYVCPSKIDVRNYVKIAKDGVNK